MREPPHQPRLTTPVEGHPPHRRIALGDPLLSMGSCFSEFIARNLVESRLPCLVNPAGTLYHPLAMAALLERILAGEPYRREELFRHEGLWHSSGHHGSFSHPHREEALAGMNRALAEAVDLLPRCRWLLLTFGTAWGWFPAGKKEAPPVANCHRLPAARFDRRLVPAGEIERTWRTLAERLRAVNPELGILFTVSPVRHRPSSPPENSLAKAELVIAVHRLTTSLGQADYFPAYEIMLDELRDYRFYGPDLVHPDGTAQRILMQRFVDNHLDDRAREFLARMAAVRRDENHRPRFPGTPAGTRFAEKLAARREALRRDFPEVEWD